MPAGVDGCVIEVERSSFVSNSADSNGGVMYTGINPATYTVQLSSFLNNTAGGDGGAMFVGRANSRVSINRSSCGSNSAINRGGAISIVGSSLMISETNIHNNSATLGAAISACNSAVDVSSDLVSSIDDTAPVCTLYDGYINRFNVSDFIRQELSTIYTTAVSVPLTTESTRASTSAAEATTAFSESESTATVQTAFTATTSKAPSNGTITRGTITEVWVAVVCVALVVMACLSALIAVFVIIRIIRKRKELG